LCERINRALAPKKAGDDQVIGKSKGGPPTTFWWIALGNPLKIMLTAGQVHDLAGADTLVPGMAAEALLADKAPRGQSGHRAAGDGRKNCRDPAKKESQEPANIRHSVVCGSPFDRELLLLGKAVPRHRDALR
jgi:hypothetical protein